MRLRYTLSAVALLICLSAVPAMAADFDFVGSMNITAKADLGAFQADLGLRFGLPAPRIQEVIRVVVEPADAFMVLKISILANVPPERVIEEYKKSRGKGWGVIAQNLGIKPGSDAFHELKKEEKIGGKKDKGKDKDDNSGKGKGNKK